MYAKDLLDIKEHIKDKKENEFLTKSFSLLEQKIYAQKAQSESGQLVKDFCSFLTQYDLFIDLISKFKHLDPLQNKYFEVKSDQFNIKHYLSIFFKDLYGQEHTFRIIVCPAPQADFVRVKCIDLYLPDWKNVSLYFDVSKDFEKVIVNLPKTFNCSDSCGYDSESIVSFDNFIKILFSLISNFFSNCVTTKNITSVWDQNN
jgi:hypothetical protein